MAYRHIPDGRRGVQFAAVGAGVLAVVLVLGGGCGSSNSAAEPNPFAGNYAGTFSGDESGTWTATVAANGHVQLTIVLDGESFPGEGSVARSGSAHLVTSGTGAGGDFTVTWDGNFTEDGGTLRGSGTWRDNWDQTGTWEGERV